ncbi:DUF7669 domain-containing protein [Metabacillus litoralis]|uniref:DUF7669 domain-containing protein n=1 Tax=Metabacillus litoralis TaxID=152268 RepID=UPI00203DF4E9|nr:hypothetical protein [Metabacillus litoralis]MCM3409558.1 hypothetical protein [Metabacillus litoralis]
MGLYKLETKDEMFEKGRLEKVIAGQIDYEKDFENWLENSPDILFEEEDEGNTVIWIGRQIRAKIANSNKYPDLMGIDSSGNLVIVELKKGKTPRDVIAQALEYSAWAASLSYEDLNYIFQDYLKMRIDQEIIDLRTKYDEVFNIEGLEANIHFNKRQIIYIVAEEIASTVQNVSEYLRGTYGLDIRCLEYTVYKTENNEFIVSTKRIENNKLLQHNSSIHKSTEQSIKTLKKREIVYHTVLKMTNKDTTKTFNPKSLYNEIIKEYPEFKENTLRLQLIQDCVNHKSRKNWSSNLHDYYFLESKGLYRLYNPSKDGKWTWEGKPEVT